MDAIRRHPRIGWVILAIAAILLFTIWRTKELDVSDGLDGVSVGLTFGTFLLACVGAGLAAVAYAQSLRSPSLAVRVWLELSTFVDPTTEEVTAEPLKEKPTEMRGMNDSFQALSPVHVCVVLENRGDATARNVTVTVELSGMIAWLGHATHSEEWTVFDDGGIPSYWLQWDGGGDLAVHPAPAPGRTVPVVRIPLIAAKEGDTVRAAAMAYADGSKPTKRDEFTIRVGTRR